MNGRVCEHVNGSSSDLMTIMCIMDSQTKLIRENFEGKKMLASHIVTPSESNLILLESLSLRKIRMCWEVVPCQLFFHITGCLS